MQQLKNKQQEQSSYSSNITNKNNNKNGTNNNNNNNNNMIKPSEEKIFEYDKRLHCHYFLGAFGSNSYQIRKKFLTSDILLLDVKKDQMNHYDAIIWFHICNFFKRNKSIKCWSFSI